MSEFSKLAKDSIVANIEDIRSRLSLDPITSADKNDETQRNQSLQASVPFACSMAMLLSPTLASR